MFKKGESGNPGGRAKSLPGLIKRCQEWADEKGIDLLMKTAENKNNDKMALAAAIYLINRGYGKPTENVKLSGELGVDAPQWAKDALKSPIVAAKISQLMGEITGQKKIDKAE